MVHFKNFPMISATENFTFKIENGRLVEDIFPENNKPFMRI